MTRILVTGAGGFIGHHLVAELKRQGHWVRGVDIKKPEHTTTAADEFLLLDLREPANARKAAEGSSTSTPSPPTWGGWVTSPRIMR